MNPVFSLSYWERTSYFEGVDICIIGSGLVGLHSAIALKERSPELRILILDSGFLPYGASTRNAGFACFGSMTELLDDLTRESEDDVFGRVQLRWEGLQRLREITGDDAIDYEPLGGYELFTKDEETEFSECRDKLNWFNNKLKEITGNICVYGINDDRIRGFGFRNISHLILNSEEGQIDTGKMMSALEFKARNLGVQILHGIKINSIEAGDKPVVYTDKDFHFSPSRVLVTTNGFARNLLPELEVEPARAQVVITEPIPNLKFKGSFHYDKGYYYFRNVGNRVLFGGGRNIDFNAENTQSFGTSTPVQNRLESLLQEVILQGTEHKIEMRWSGIMGMGPVKSPILKETGKNIFCAVRMGGMGVAIGSMVGIKAAQMIYG